MTCPLYVTSAIGESEESSGASTPGSEKEVVVGSTVATAGSLTQHPVRQGVMDFLRLIVLDSLPLNVTGKTAPVSYGHYVLLVSNTVFHI